MSNTQSAAQATEALIDQYGRLVFQVIYGLTGDWHESQDLTQDTFLAAFKAIEAARQASSANFHAKAWLMQFLLVETNAPKSLGIEQKRDISSICFKHPEIVHGSA